MNHYAKIEGVSCYTPVGSFYSFSGFFRSVHGKQWKGKTIKGSLDVAEFLIEEAKVALVPGIAFGADNNLRLSFATSMDKHQRRIEPDRIRVEDTTLLIEHSSTSRGWLLPFVI